MRAQLLVLLTVDIDSNREFVIQLTPISAIDLFDYFITYYTTLPEQDSPSAGK